MVDIFTISRTGGAYTDTVFNKSKTNPSVLIHVAKWTWTGKDQELAIDIPETTSATQPSTIAGGFKRATRSFRLEGFLSSDTGGDDTQEKIEKLWNIFEFASPAATYGVYRGSNLFGIVSPTEGQLKIVSLQIEENAVISKPAQSISGSVSEPYRVKVTMELRMMKRST